MITLQAVDRLKIGTNNSRYVRRVNHQVPAIIYGKKIVKKRGLLILLEHEKVFDLYKKNFLNASRLLIRLEKEEFYVTAKDIQHHAFKPILLHIDFLCI
ncbi:50S ribosomal protein L25 [Buchnera aphidicola]|uniref:50S ribosomal protein L25 n=1 Tax=Buchnera aphidicola TaxID=9 RepID=UPI00094CFABC|nr:50S ribosomal protein L25 [Buchnera aphidicola]